MIKIKDMVPYPNSIWGAQLENGEEIQFPESLLKLPEGEYILYPNDFETYFVNPDTGEITFVYREFGTNKIKLHEVDITAEIEKLLEDEA